MLKDDLFFVIKPVCFCESRKVCMCNLTLQFMTCNSLESEPSLSGSDQWCWLVGQHAQCKTLCSAQNQGQVNSCSALWVSVAQDTSESFYVCFLTSFWSLIQNIQKPFTVAAFSTNITFSCWRTVSHSLGSWDLNDCFEIVFFITSEDYLI